MSTTSKYTREDLAIMRAWPLERKIQVTQTKILEWYEYWGGQVYVSISGGKDSTVLLDLARRVCPDIPAVFCDTGLEWPESRVFAMSQENVTRIYPIKYDFSTKKYSRMTFKEVLDRYGYPVISKEVASLIRQYRSSKTDEQKQKLLDGNRWGMSKIPRRWYDLLYSDIPVSDQCCFAMKKYPFKVYERESGRKGIIGTTTEESLRRTTMWLRDGCNAFDASHPISKPISFWTEQDILTYLKRFNIPYCSLYGDIVENEEGKLITTGLQRTGCMFCMFGVHLEGYPNRFQKMQVTHPKQWEYCMKPVEEHGLGLAKVLDFIGVDWKDYKEPTEEEKVNSIFGDNSDMDEDEFM